MKLELVQAGEGEVRDLLIWSMGDVQEVLRKGAPKDTILYYFNGAGTSSYENAPTMDQLEKDLLKRSVFQGVKFAKRALAGWSAGGRAVQTQLAQCRRTGVYPDAIMVADGLYAPYKAPKQPDPTKLQSVADYALKAASTADGPRCILWHSDIYTPGYASSKECTEWVKDSVELALGFHMTTPPVPPKLDGRPIKSFFQLNNFVVIGYAGKGKEEHIAEVQMMDEVMQTYIPWFSDQNIPVLGDYVYFPEVVIEPAPPKGDETLVEGILQIAKQDSDSGVREYDSRVLQMLRNFGVGAPNNWCAVAVGTWLREASARLKVKAPIAGSAGAKATMAQFQKVGRWKPVMQMKPGDIRPGMVPIWDRHDPKNPKSQPWWGHIGVVLEPIDSFTFWTYEGNSTSPNGKPDGVNKVRRSLSDPKILGFGWVD